MYLETTRLEQQDHLKHQLALRDQMIEALEARVRKLEQTALVNSQPLGSTAEKSPRVVL